MQLLELGPCELGVHSHGIYVVDDEERRVIAGLFDTVTSAVAWIDDRRTLNESAPAHGGVDD